MSITLIIRLKHKLLPQLLCPNCLTKHYIFPKGSNKCLTCNTVYPHGTDEACNLVDSRFKIHKMGRLTLL